MAGIALGATEHEIPDRFHDFAENVSSIFQVLTFFVFGALIVATGYDGSIPALVAFVLLALLVARPVAMFISLDRDGLPPARARLHGVVRPEGGGLDAVRAARA